ncbi:MAG: hypothetical protein HZA64_09440 [Rhodocyclales bacterium]|nr:hypothetical protein [Rhodocyclales bacterium]MBI5785668.1 hypothetical protein [Rhodocyclales bacterium]
MSRLFPDQIQVSLAPDQVIVERRGARVSLKGIGTQLLDRRILRAFGTAGRSKHEAALQVMASALATVEDRQRCRATVVLANSLVRYLLVPHSSRLGPEDDAAVVRHCFQEVYGDAAERWELRASPASDLPLRLASGIERSLIEDLRSVMTTLGMRLDSVQPRLMAVCNEHRRLLDRQPAWLILVEPGMLCLGLLDRGNLVRLRSLRVDAHWAADLPALLEREACLAELDEMPADAFLWLRLGTVPSAPLSLPLRLHELRDPWPISQADAAGPLAVVRS